MAIFDYQFSVGVMKVGGIDVGVMTEITVSYDGDPQSLYGGDYRLPIAIELGNRVGEITAMSTRWEIDEGPLLNEYVSIILGFGENGGGLVGTITDTKVTNYSVTSTQNDFVTSDLTLNIADPKHILKGVTPPTWT